MTENWFLDQLPSGAHAAQLAVDPFHIPATGGKVEISSRILLPQES